MITSIRILGHDYTVEVRDALGAFAKSCYSDTRIIIDCDQVDDHKISTLLHEVIELINIQLELKMEHSQICGMETGVYQFLVENGIDLTPLLGK